MSNVIRDYMKTTAIMNKNILHEPLYTWNYFFFLKKRFNLHFLYDCGKRTGIIMHISG